MAVKLSITQRGGIYQHAGPWNWVNQRRCRIEPGYKLVKRYGPAKWIKQLAYQWRR